MRAIEIGDRLTKDLEQDELRDYLCDFGYCGSNEFWSEPKFDMFEYDARFNGVFFKFHQIRESDNERIETDGQIYLTFHKSISGRYDCSLYLTKWGHYNMKIADINHFIKLGFDMPVLLNEK